MAESLSLFLRTHPKFAEAYNLTSRTGDSSYVTTFLRQHRAVADEWQRHQAGMATRAAATPQPAAPNPPAPAGPTSADLSAGALVSQFLSQYGLGTIGQKAWQRYLETGSAEQVFAEIRSNADWTGGVYAARFPAMAELRKQGRAVSEDTYIRLEQGYKEAFHAYGIPLDFAGENNITKLMTSNVGVQEFNDRLEMRSQVVGTSPRAQHIRNEMARLFQDEGVTGLNADGLTLAYWIDPNKGNDVIKRQFTAAQMAASAQETGFGTLNKSQAERVAGTGVSADQAQGIFSNLAQLSPLENPLDQGSASITGEDLLSAGFEGNAQAQKKIAREQRRRVAQFEAGGTFASSREGVSGLGSAATQ